MKYTFVFNCNYYVCRQNGAYVGLLCKDHLADLFDLSDNPETIDVVITEKPSKNSYLVNKISRTDYDLIQSNITIQLSSGKLSHRFISSNLRINVLDKLPESFYVSVLA